MEIFLKREDIDDEFISLTKLNSTDDVELYLLGYCIDVLQLNYQQKPHLVPYLVDDELCFKFQIVLANRLTRNVKYIKYVFNRDRSFNRICHLGECDG